MPDRRERETETENTTAGTGNVYRQLRTIEDSVGNIRHLMAEIAVKEAVETQREILTADGKTMKQEAHDSAQMLGMGLWIFSMMCSFICGALLCWAI